MTHWLRQLNRTRLQPEKRTRPRNITSIRYPFAVTCPCGVKTAQSRTGYTRPHAAKRRKLLKHKHISAADLTACYAAVRPAWVSRVQG